MSKIIQFLTGDVMSVLIDLVLLILTSIAILFSIRSYMRDRAVLRIELQYHQQTGRGTAFLVLLRNCGRHPIQVKGVLLVLKGSKILFHPDVPLIVEAETTQQRWFNLYDFLERLDEPAEFSQIARIDVYDIRNKRYRFPSWKRGTRRDFRAVKRQVAEHWTPGNKDNSWLDSETDEQVAS